jgi:hypothetical protein
MNDFILDSKVPSGPLHKKWSNHKENLGTFSEEKANKYKIISL